ncbi:MAG: Ig-like domain-containing protein, partial [Sphingomicrobium sp.]
MAVGSYTLTARATDSLGATTTSAPVSISVTPNALPSVSFALPYNTQRFLPGQPIHFIANASDTDGSIARVEFLMGGTVIGSVSSPPYLFEFTDYSTGFFVMTARAVDNRGALASANLAFSLYPLAVTITSPLANATLASDFVMVSGTFVAPANSGVVVNGVRAQTFGNQFVANDVPLSEGANTITVTVETADGQTFTATRNVTRSGSAPFRVYLDPEGGLAPLTSTIRVDSRTDLTIAGVGYENLGTATLDPTGVDQQMLGKLTLTNPGMVTPTIVIIDSAGTVYRQSVGMRAADKVATDALLKNLWNAHAAKLAAGRVDLALAALPPAMAARYQPVLEPLGPHFAQIVPTWSAPATGVLGNDIGEFTITRAIEGQPRMFFIYFVKDDRGLW